MRLFQYFLLKVTITSPQNKLCFALPSVLGFTIDLSNIFRLFHYFLKTIKISFNQGLKPHNSFCSDFFLKLDSTTFTSHVIFDDIEEEKSRKKNYEFFFLINNNKTLLICSIGIEYFHGLSSRSRSRKIFF